jgi:hypothetical protein
MRLPNQAAPVPRSAPTPSGVSAQSIADAPCTGDPSERARCEAARVRASGGADPYRAYAKAPYDCDSTCRSYSPAYSNPAAY